MERPLQIDATQARHKSETDQAVLVCAYEDEARCEQLRLHGALTLKELEAQVAQRTPRYAKDAEIIFYCECPQQETSTGKAREYEDAGYTNVRVLAGGVRNWKMSGYPMAAETPPENPPAA